MVVHLLYINRGDRYLVEVVQNRNQEQQQITISNKHKVMQSSFIILIYTRFGLVEVSVLLVFSTLFSLYAYTNHNVDRITLFCWNNLIFVSFSSHTYSPESVLFHAILKYIITRYLNDFFKLSTKLCNQFIIEMTITTKARTLSLRRLGGWWLTVTCGRNG